MSDSSVAMPAVALLTFELVGPAARIRLDTGRNALAEPILEEMTLPLAAAAVASLAEAGGHALSHPPSPHVAEDTREAGTLLYRTLIPEALRARMQAIAGQPLLISTSFHGIPWELLHDGIDFWGLRYALGRRLILQHAPRVTPPPQRSGDRVRALLVSSDPRGDLRLLSREIDVLCERLCTRVDVACLAGPLATPEAVLRHIAEGFDVIHYCGHVVGSRDEGFALLLADDTPLPGALITSNLCGRPIVFLNGCASTAASGMAQAFLLGGAQATIGPSVDVADPFATEMAAEFYRHLVDGVAVGESLRRARLAMRAGAASEMTGLSFTLFGNPLLSVGVPGLPDLDPSLRTDHHADSRTPSRRTLLVLALAVVIGMAAWASLHRGDSSAPVAPPAGVAVGVMTIEARDGAVPAWMRNVTRDSLNTILSKFDGVRVFARQKIDFLRDKRGLTEIEVAEALGMTKMLSARLMSRNARVTLVVEIVDIKSGLLDGVEEVQGPEDHLIELLNELATKTLRVLGVRPTQEQLRRALATRTNETLDGYRMLSDTLEAGTPSPARRNSDDAPTSWLAWPRAAYAQAPTSDQDAIQHLLGAYEHALEAKDVAAVASLQLDMPPAQRESLNTYFRTANELDVAISAIDVLVEGDEALATFTRADTFMDEPTGRRIHLEVQINATLRRTAAGWRIENLRGPS